MRKALGCPDLASCHLMSRGLISHRHMRAGGPAVDVAGGLLHPAGHV